MHIVAENLTICSYNIFWKIMELAISNIKPSELKKYRANIINNITTVRDYFDPDILCFQEASGFESIIKLFDDKNYCHHLSFADPEYLLTVWNSSRLLFESVQESSFQRGRPFNIFIFFDKIKKKRIMIINIHAPHNLYTQTAIFNPIQKVITNHYNNISVSRIAIIGDFNRNIALEIKSDPSKYKLNVGKNIFNFYSYKNNSSINTCCGIDNNVLLKFAFDNVIDSYQDPIFTTELSKEKWYKSPASDHMMILSVLV